MGLKCDTVLFLLASVFGNSSCTFFVSKSSSVDCQNIRKRFYKLVVEYGIKAPDGFPQQVILINRTFPGPQLIAFQHEDLIVEVVNKLDHGITMHFHGLLQMSTIESDGSPGVVQTPISPNCSHIYKMHIGNQVGTFIYHTHVGLDIVWAHGALIVKDNPLTWATYPKPYVYDYNKDKVIFLQEIFHIPLKHFEDSLINGPFKGIPEIASLLINGKSYGIWNDSIAYSGYRSDEGYEIINVKRGYTYRFRVISMAVENMLWFKIHNHTMKIIEIDGIVCAPVVTDHLEINSAQRYSVLVKMNRPIDNYLIETRIIGGLGPRNGIAILHYHKAKNSKPMQKVLRPGKTDNALDPSEWILPKLHPNMNIIQGQVYPIPSKVNRNILISSQVVILHGNVTRFEINGNIAKESSKMHEITYLQKVRSGINIIKEPEVFEITVGDAVQVVFQNRMIINGLCLQHPWHIHGHHVYVVGEGPDLYKPETSDSIIEKNIRKGKLQLRDVIILFPSQIIENKTVGASCGWVAVRFIAKNPGLWLAHCHITAHSIMGKRFVFWEHSMKNPRLIGL